MPSVVRVPRAENPLLHAQAGIFTLVQGSDPPPLDELIYKHAPRPARLLHRFTLPWSEAPKLLLLLAAAGVSGASVFPGYRGVVEGVHERQLWSRS